MDTENYNYFDADIMRDIRDDRLWERYDALHSRVMTFLKKNLSEESHHEPYDGRLEVSFVFPSYFEESELIEEPYINIKLSCHLLIPAPAHECNWDSCTFAMALYKAELDINRWIEWAEKKEG